MRPHSLLLAPALLACTPTRAPSVERETQSAAAPEATAAPPAPVPEPPAPLPPLPVPEPALVPDGPAVPGFAIYTAEQTFVVTGDGTTTVVGEGLWLQDDRSSPPALRHTLIVSKARAEAMQLPACACLSLPGACVVERPEQRSFDPQTGSQAKAPNRPCECVLRAEPDGYPSLDIDGEHYEACAGGDDHTISAIVGGQLFYQGWEWNGACMEGLSIYDATDWTLDLIADPPDWSTERMRKLGCDPEFGPAFVQRPWPIDRSTITTDCEDYFESEVFVLRRGELWAVRDDISGVHGIRHYLRRAARPDTCPSVNDPCGDPEPFRKRAKLDRRSREFWIATDGGVALTAEGRRYSLWAADTDASVDFELPGAHASKDVLGVRAHADIRPLRAVIAKHPEIGVEPAGRAPTVVDPEQCLASHAAPQVELGAKGLGNLCFELIGIEQFVDAQWACLHGLAAATEPSTQGAILYNLGRIAEAEGANEQAIAHYQASLAVRPGNATVERRLAKLVAKSSR